MVGSLDAGEVAARSLAIEDALGEVVLRILEAGFGRGLLDPFECDRAGLGAQPGRVEKSDPRGLTLEEAVRRLAEVESAWTGYLAALDDATVGRTFEYQSLEGGWYRNTIADILTQVLGHS